MSASIAAKWFTLPNFVLLLPIPLASLATLVFIHRLLADRDSVEAKAWTLFAALTLVCLLAMAGLAYSIAPHIVIGQMTVWESAAPTETLLVVLVGVVITLPLIIAYTIMVHRIFKGKATHLSYD